MFTSRDALNLKKDFPIFSQLENRELIYLDNAATTQKPGSVINAITDFYIRSNANAHRSSHRLARAATDILENAREQVAHFVGAFSADEIIFCRGATEGLNLLAYTLSETLEPGDEIILSKAEHHANIVPWQMAAKRMGLLLKYLPMEGSQGILGKPDIQSLKSLVTDRTRVISLTAASNVLGFKNELSDVKEILSELPDQQQNHIRYIVDASQILAHESLSVSEIGCDFLVGSAHKFYGPTGVGILYARREAMRLLPPWQGGGEMISKVDLFESVYSEGIHRFEAGTSSLASIAGLGRCVEYLRDLDRPAIAEYEARLLKDLHRGLAERDDITLFTQADNNVGIATFAPKSDVGIQDLAYWFDERDIACRLGRHCAHPLADELGINAALRVSLAAYNCEDDVNRFLLVLDEAMNELKTVGEQPSAGVFVEPVEEPRIDDVSELSLSALEEIEDWQTRFKTILLWGENIAPKHWLHKSEYELPDCDAKAWFHATETLGRFRFFIDSESRVVKGLAAVLLCMIDNKSKQEIEAIDLHALFTRLGLEKNLSQSRANGFTVLMSKVEEVLRR